MVKVAPGQCYQYSVSGQGHHDLAKEEATKTRVGRLFVQEWGSKATTGFSPSSDLGLKWTQKHSVPGTPASWVGDLIFKFIHQGG